MRDQVSQSELEPREALIIDTVLVKSTQVDLTRVGICDQRWGIRTGSGGSGSGDGVIML